MNPLANHPRMELIMKDFQRITVRNLTKRFGDKTAVDDFSIEFGKGEFVTFLGPSGCGKSTALNCITGLIPITSGEIYVDDECIDDSQKRVAPEKRGFGMVFQNYALFPHLSVKENIAFGLKILKLPKSEIERKVSEALKLVHLEGYGSKFPAQMSGGEQQRVAIARCIVLEPRLLLLDEPLSNLDAKLRVELRYELKALHERLKVATIYVTHDQSEALALSDRIVVLKFGKIQQVGSPQEIYSDPANAFVADFVGYKNAWEGRLEKLEAAGEGLAARVRISGGLIEAKLAYSAKDPRRAALEAAFKDGSPVATAVRPEDIVPGGKGGENCLKCVAGLVEYQGKASQVAATFAGADGQRIDIRSSQSIREGESFEACVDPNKVLVFAAGEKRP
jgi:putative spermidine/putrescine transport system ATP-binding protein